MAGTGFPRRRYAQSCSTVAELRFGQTGFITILVYIPNHGKCSVATLLNKF